MDSALVHLAEHLCKRGERLLTIESCSGGALAARCTAQPGASEWFFGGLIPYAVAAKKMWLHPTLEVDPCSLLCAHALAEKGLTSHPVDWCIAVVGYASSPHRAHYAIVSQRRCWSATFSQPLARTTFIATLCQQIIDDAVHCIVCK